MDEAGLQVYCKYCDLKSDHMKQVFHKSIFRSAIHAYWLYKDKSVDSVGY